MENRHDYINSPVEIKEELLGFFSQSDALVIFDIGACEAEDSIRYSSLFPHSTIYAFEPREDNFLVAKELIRKFNKTNIVLENIALSDKNGTAEFYLSEGNPIEFENTEHWNYGNKSSSLLPPSDGIRKHTSWLEFNIVQKVNTLKLEDYVMAKQLSCIDFAHIDVQGAELMVLNGAGFFLKNIKMIWLEVELVELYKGQPLKRNVEQFMFANNFVNILDAVNNVSGDQLYVNRRFYSDSKIRRIKRLKNRNYYLSRLRSFLKFN